MASDQRFSHITVNANEDDDVVIQAGACAPIAQTRPQTWEQSHPDQAQYGESKPAAQAQAPQEEPAEYCEPEPEPEPVTEHVPASAKAPTSQRPAKHQEYHEQTLEDLDAGPMSKMQKIVLACVALFIVGFAVYYIAFMH